MTDAVDPGGADDRVAPDDAMLAVVGIVPRDPEPTPLPSEGALPLPSLDIVRIDARGATVVAGAGIAGAEVILRLDGQEIATARTDAAGNFVALFDTLPSEMPRILTLETRDTEGTVARADDSVIVAPGIVPGPNLPDPAPVITTSERPAEGREVVVPESDDAAPTATGPPPAVAAISPDGTREPSLTALPGTDAMLSKVEGIAARSTPSPPSAQAGPSPAPERAGDATPEGRALPRVTSAAVGAPRSQATERPDAPAGTIAEPVTAAAPRLFRAGPDGVSVLPDDNAAPDVRTTLGIDAITYDTAGDVRLAGRGGPDSRIRIYLDNRAVTLAQVDGTGAWTAPLPDVQTGVYTLRIDALDVDGTVISRVETPFERTAPAIAAAARRDGVAAITVQPGFTLWAISKGYFGEGARYVQIFEANRGQIRDPDLIFPGQVFALPKLSD